MPPGVAWEQLVDARTVELTANNNTPYNNPVKDFWSVVLYCNQTRSMIQTDQRFPSVSSQDKSLQVNPDGSVDVYFGPKAPAGKESN